MRVGYYPGCSLEKTGKPYDLSARAVCRGLDVELCEVPGWICCGSSPALKMSRLLSLSLAAKNLLLAEKDGIEDVVVPCPFCFRRLLSAQQEIRDDRPAGIRAEQVIEARMRGDVRVRSLLDFMHGAVGLRSIEERIRKPLSGLKAVSFYGCYIVKPSQVIRPDNPEDPTSMDEVLSALGAEVLDWDFKTECCGASLSISKKEKVLELSGRIVKEALFRGADAIVVACQLCQSNLDIRQGEIWKREGRKEGIPVLYFTQLMGLSFGLPASELGLKGLIVDPIPLLRQKGLAP